MGNLWRLVFDVGAARVIVGHGVGITRQREAFSEPYSGSFLAHRMVVVADTCQGLAWRCLMGSIESLITDWLFRDRFTLHLIPNTFCTTRTYGVRK